MGINFEIYAIIVCATKDKDFALSLYKVITLTKSNLTKRHWNENKKYCFSDEDETIHHLLFSCLFECLVSYTIVAFSLPLLANLTNILCN